MKAEMVGAKIAGLSSEIISLVDGAMKRVEGEIIQRNRKQLLEGYTSDEKFMQSGYKPTQKKKREKKGLQTGHVDLSFEGDYQGKMRAEWDGEYVKIWSDDWKEKKEYGGEPLLQYHWGNILGLNEKNMEWLTDKLEDELYNGIKRYFT